MLGIDAIRRSTSADFDTVRRALETTQGYAGLTGTYRMWADDHTGVDDRALLLIEVGDQAFRIVE